MSTILYCCRCENLFSKDRKTESFPNTGTKCTRCQSDESIELNIYPTDRNCNEIAPAPWEFICLKCLIYFEIPSPSTPEQAHSVKCPACQGTDIKQLNICSLETIEKTCFG